MLLTLEYAIKRLDPKGTCGLDKTQALRVSKLFSVIGLPGWKGIGHLGHHVGIGIVHELGEGIPVSKKEAASRKHVNSSSSSSTRLGPNATQVVNRGNYRTLLRTCGLNERSALLRQTGVDESRKRKDTPW